MREVRFLMLVVQVVLRLLVREFSRYLNNLHDWCNYERNSEVVIASINFVICIIFLRFNVACTRSRPH